MTDTTTGSTRTEELEQAAKEVVGDVKAKTAEIGRQAKEEGRQVFEEMKDRARDQADGQARRAAGSLKGVATQLDSMAEASPEQGFVVDIARNGADQIGRLADRLENDGVDGIFADIESLARRRPGLFLAASFGLGMALTRLLRASDMDSMKRAVSDTNGSDEVNSGEWMPEAREQPMGGPVETLRDTGMGGERTPGA